MKKYYIKREIKERLSSVLRSIKSIDTINNRLLYRLISFHHQIDSKYRYIIIQVGTKKNIRVFINGQEVFLWPKKYLLLMSFYEIPQTIIVDWENLLVIPNNCIMIKTTAAIKARKNPSLVCKTVICTNDFIERSRNNCSYDQHRGLIYGCYDLDDHTYRLSSWVWTNAIIAKAWWTKYSIQGCEESRKKAEELSKLLIDWQIKDGDNKGAFICRTDIVPDAPMGNIRWLAPNDSALIGGYSLSPLYKYSKDKNIYNSIVSLGEWVVNAGMKSDGRLRVGYNLDEKYWDDNWLYVDSGFTNVLFRELFSITGDDKWRKACVLFSDWYISNFSNPSGAMNSAWFSKRVYTSHNYFSRGQGWAIEGLIAAYECTKKEKYLVRAFKCADFCVREQNSNGSWYYEIGDSDGGECNKATPVLAYVLARISEYTKNNKYHNAAKRALSWCKSHIYNGNDKNAKGGIVTWTWEGCITRPRNRRTAVPYANAYANMAKLILEKEHLEK